MLWERIGISIILSVLPSTEKLTRQPNIKAGANKFKTKQQRLLILKILQRVLQMLLEKGFSPYADKTALEKQLFEGLNPKSTLPRTLQRTLLVMLQRMLFVSS
jgi:hypothetical protein